MSEGTFSEMMYGYSTHSKIVKPLSLRLLFVLCVASTYTYTQRNKPLTCTLTQLSQEWDIC